VLQAKSHPFLKVKKSSNSEVFSFEDCEKELLDEMLRLEMFTYISKSETRHVVPFLALNFRNCSGFLHSVGSMCPGFFPLAWRWNRLISKLSGFFLGGQFDCQSLFDLKPFQGLVSR